MLAESKRNIVAAGQGEEGEKSKHEHMVDMQKNGDHSGKMKRTVCVCGGGGRHQR